LNTVPPGVTRDKKPSIHYTINTQISFYVNVSNPEVHIYNQLRTILPTIIKSLYKDNLGQFEGQVDKLGVKIKPKIILRSKSIARITPITIQSI